MKKPLSLALSLILLCFVPGQSFATFHVIDPDMTFAQQQNPDQKVDRMKREESQSKRSAKYYYGYIEREHSFKESLGHIAALYGISWLVYPLSQFEAFKEEGSFKRYGKNFGKLTFDKDEPFWNQIIHPISGSQLYLYYRANGYKRIDSFLMTFVSSALFETTIEVYTEPASVQDLYITPVYGTILGLGLENLSMYLLNTGNAFGKIWGHVINPTTLLWFYEGRVRLTPSSNLKNEAALTLTVEF